MVVIPDPLKSCHITDLKFLTPSYVICRTKNSVSLIDLNNRHMEPLISEIKNGELFCEKIVLKKDRLMYVTLLEDKKTVVKEILFPP
jgi:hypothetical protein